nr:uncharacterized protein LOC109147987 [Ipomoea trifida]
MSLKLIILQQAIESKNEEVNSKDEMQVYTQRQRILQGMKKQLLKSLVHNEDIRKEKGGSLSTHILLMILKEFLSVVKKTKSAPANDVLDVAKVVEASEIQIVPDAEGKF